MVKTVMFADSIAILIRSHNDCEFIGETLRRIRAQKCPLPFRIYCCDDDSTDGTAEIIRSHSDVVMIPRPEGHYMPGRTLNRMIRESSGVIVVFNNADAVPQNDHWLVRLIAPLLSGKADAVYANQLPRSNARYLVRKDHERAFGDGVTAGRWRFFFSLASSATLRTTLEMHWFDETYLYSEDIEWAYRNKLRLGYAPDAYVEHSHNYSYAELKRRFYGEGYAAARIFGTAPTFARTLAGVCCETLCDYLYLLRHPAGLAEFPSVFPRRWLQKFCARAGALDFLKGRAHA